MEVEAARGIAEKDDESVVFAVGKLETARINLRAAMVEQQAAHSDATHSTWHKKVIADSSKSGEGSSRIDLINASWARIRSS